MQVDKRQDENKNIISSTILEYRCLYTHDLKRKAKRWQDGILRYHTFNNRIMVWDLLRNFIGDTYNPSGLMIEEGDEFELEKNFIIVQVQDSIGKQETDITELIKSRQKATSLSSQNGKRVIGQKHKSLNDLLHKGKLKGQSIISSPPPIIQEQQQQQQQQEEEEIINKKRQSSNIEEEEEEEQEEEIIIPKKKKLKVKSKSPRTMLITNNDKIIKPIEGYKERLKDRLSKIGQKKELPKIKSFEYILKNDDNNKKSLYINIPKPSTIINIIDKEEEEIIDIGPWSIEAKDLFDKWPINKYI